MNYSDSLRLHASFYPDRECAVCQERHVTFAQLNTRANKIANAVLGLGLKRGDKVSVLLYNCYEYLEIFHALARIGVALVPISYRFVPREIEYQVNNSESKGIIYGAEFADRVEQAWKNFENVPESNLIHIGREGRGHDYESWAEKGSANEVIVPLNETDILNMVYTSGTTGFPKGAIAMNSSQLARALIFTHEFGITGRDRILINMPLFHSNALTFSNIVIYLGGTAVIMPRFDGEGALATIRKHRTTCTSMVPQQYERILNLPDATKRKYDVRSMKTLVCSSSPLHPQTRLGIIDFFSSAGLYEFYGSTEAGVVTLMLPDDHVKRPNSVGREAFLQKVRLLNDDHQDVPLGEVGEIFSKSIVQFGGYYKMPEATKEVLYEGWFTAGDLAYKDEEGYYYLTDRKKDMIISGGENIYPVELEQVIATHPKVLDVAVIGVPEKQWGEVPKAIVVVKEGQQVTEEEILEYCRERLAKFKQPKGVDFVEALPRNPTGKVERRILKDKYWEGYDKRIA
jgi:acyl-CoA synthetase (AMP-forming)/AMP-acid ligase II